MKHTDYRNIVEAAAKLTGSKAQTSAGAWKALRPWIAKRRGASLRGRSIDPRYGANAPTEVMRYTRPGNGFGSSDPRLLSPRAAWKRYQWRYRAERGGDKIIAANNLHSRWGDLTSGNPTDPYNIALSLEHRPMSRNQYGALYLHGLGRSTDFGETGFREDWFLYYAGLPVGWADAWECVKAVESLPDEHGGWEQRSDWDDKGRGEQISVDLYGIDAPSRLYVIQVRQSFREHKGYFLSVRKSYFLLGYNENGNAFAHPISSSIVHAAIKRDSSPESPVKAAQAWIWGITESELPGVLRNGDVALIPTKQPRKFDSIDTSGKRRIIDSHWVYSKEIRINGTIYAIDPTLRHLKGQHPTQRGKGWFRVVVGNRAAHHDFARPTMD